jgi:hypothetical protein
MTIDPVVIFALIRPCSPTVSAPEEVIVPFTSPSMSNSFLKRTSPSIATPLERTAPDRPAVADSLGRRGGDGWGGEAGGGDEGAGEAGALGFGVPNINYDIRLEWECRERNFMGRRVSILGLFPSALVFPRMQVILAA